jgi:hypothetical protein
MISTCRFFFDAPTSPPSGIASIRTFALRLFSFAAAAHRDVYNALRQLTDVTGASEALAHSQIPLLEAHQSKGGVRQMDLNSNRGRRSTARPRNRIDCIASIRKSRVKNCHVRLSLTWSPRSDGDDPTADAA